MTMEQLTVFLGWNSVINIGMLILATLSLAMLRGWAMSMHSVLTGVAKEDLPNLYFQYLAAYKVLILVLCVVPYIALRVMV